MFEETQQSQDNDQSLNVPSACFLAWYTTVSYPCCDEELELAPYLYDRGAGWSYHTTDYKTLDFFCVRRQNTTFLHECCPVRPVESRLERTLGIFDKTGSHTATSRANFSGEDSTSVGKKKEAAAEICGRLVSVNRAMRYVTYVYLKYVIGLLINIA